MRWDRAESTDRLYAVFRAAYYGYPLIDVEYFQVNVSRADGAVSRILLETSGSDSYFQAIPAHIVSHVDAVGEATYTQRLTTPAGVEISSSRPSR